MNPTTVTRLTRFLVVFIIIMSLILAAEIAIVRARQSRPGTAPKNMTYAVEIR